MDIQTIKQNCDLVSLAQEQVALKKTDAYHIGPCPFCGGEDRFTIKHTSRGDRWHCRGCGGDRYHSVIDFVMRRDGLSFLEAVQRLGRDAVPSSLRGTTPSPLRDTIPSPLRDTIPSPLRDTIPSPLRDTTPSPLRGTTPSPLRGTTPSPLRGTTPSPLRDTIPSPLQGHPPERNNLSKSDKTPYPSSKPRRPSRSASLPSERWQAKGRDFLLKASEALLDDPKASIARAYLKTRKLEQGTWLRASLGYTKVYDPKLGVKRPAVCIPHLDRKLNLCGIKYRFCDPQTGGLRYISHRGSRPWLYGLENLLPNTHTCLLVVEGELNQLSLLQVLSRHPENQPGVSVVSTGGEGLNPVQAALLKQVALGYPRVIVWMDKGSAARQAAGLIRAPCRMLRSPMGLDANDLLCKGWLWGFLEKVLGS